jgi:integrase/recombinase XerC
VKQDKELYPYRRHSKTCPFFGPGGREVRLDKCNCTFHVDGVHSTGERPRLSLKTRSRQIAERRIAELVWELDAKREARQAIVGVGTNSVVRDSPPQDRSVAEAVERFLALSGSIKEGKYSGNLERGTWRKYKNSLTLFAKFCFERSIISLADVAVADLEDFGIARNIKPVTWKVELQTLRTFFAHCVSRDWVTKNLAKDIKPPRNIKPNEVIPYTIREESLILAACEEIGGGRAKHAGPNYERLRARAMVMVLRATALRVSDVCTLRKDAISWDDVSGTWRIFLRTQKTGDAVLLPIPEQLKLALDSLPLPRNAALDCSYYFWNAITSRRAAVGIAERTLGTVFKKSGVTNAHAHRFRHTLATRLLGNGATCENVADILGNSPEVVRKHYAKWSKERQDKIDELMFQHFETGATNAVTKKSHEKMGAVN